jgi:hypothetical protein
VSTEHDLKTWPAYFQAVADGRKTFEIRRNDRVYQAGDVLLLREWDPLAGGEAYTGRSLRVPVLWVLPGGEFGLDKGHVAMSLGPVEDAPAAAALGPWRRFANGKCRNCGVFRSVDDFNVCRPCVTGEDPEALTLDQANAVFEAACAQGDEPLAAAAERVIAALSLGEPVPADDHKAVAEARS